MADLDTDPVIGALTMAITEETDLTWAGDDALYLDANIMLAAPLLLEVELVVHKFIVVCLRVCTHIL